MASFFPLICSWCRSILSGMTSICASRRSITCSILVVCDMSIQLVDQSNPISDTSCHVIGVLLDSWLHVKNQSHTGQRCQFVTVSASRCLVAAFNGGSSPSSGFSNCPRTQVPNSRSNSSRRLKCSKPPLTHTHSPANATLTSTNRITLRLVVYRQLVRVGAKPLGDHDQRFHFFKLVLAITVFMYHHLWRGWVYFSWIDFTCVKFTYCTYSMLFKSLKVKVKSKSQCDWRSVNQ
jgi:hypothetical protein